MSTPTNEEIAKKFVHRALGDVIDDSALSVSEMLWDEYSMPDSEADERLGDILELVTAIAERLQGELK